MKNKINNSEEEENNTEFQENFLKPVLISKIS